MGVELDGNLRDKINQLASAIFILNNTVSASPAEYFCLIRNDVVVLTNQMAVLLSLIDELDRARQDVANSRENVVTIPRLRIVKDE